MLLMLLLQLRISVFVTNVVSVVSVRNVSAGKIGTIDFGNGKGFVVAKNRQPRTASG